MSSNCIFCSIIRGESLANIIYKDEDFVVFHSVKPSAPVHVLIVPVEHIESVNELKEHNVEVVSKMILKSKEIAGMEQKLSVSHFPNNFNTSCWVRSCHS